MSARSLLERDQDHEEEKGHGRASAEADHRANLLHGVASGTGRAGDGEDAIGNCAEVLGESRACRGCDWSGLRHWVGGQKTPRPGSRNTGRLSERVFTGKSLAGSRARVNGPHQLKISVTERSR